MRVQMIKDPKAYEAEQKAGKHRHGVCLHPLFGLGVAIAILAVATVAWYLVAGGFGG